MIRLAISVEGPTEAEFIRRVITEHLWQAGVAPDVVLLGRRGGDANLHRLARDMATLYWNYDCVTSLVDFYGFRGKDVRSPDELEHAIGEEVEKRIGRDWDPSRVIPYVQRHEFEALLFSCVGAFGGLVYSTDRDINALRSIRLQFPTPEDINDGANTHPSKRIQQVMARYSKVVDGVQVASAIGLSRIRAECPRFNKWMMHLESLSNPSARM